MVVILSGDLGQAAVQLVERARKQDHEHALDLFLQMVVNPVKIRILVSQEKLLHARRNPAL